MNLTQFIPTEHDNVAGIIIEQSGNIIDEQYFNGYQANDTIHIASVTKSVVSVLVGIAIDRGFIDSADQLVLDFFPNYTLKKREKTLPQLTIRHLLTMTAPYKFKSEPYTKVYSTNDWTTATLDLLGGKSLSGEFKYTTIGLQVLSGILTHATGQSLCEFASRHLFEPLGITTPPSHAITDKESYFAFIKGKHVNGWVCDQMGVNTAGWGLTLSTKGLLNFGRMMRNHGVFADKQIVSADWIAESTRHHSQWGTRSYGYLWWRPKDAYAGIGDGGNIIYVHPQKSIVIAITSTFKPRAKDRIELIEQHILPML